jgi:hypothetical protein
MDEHRLGVLRLSWIKVLWRIFGEERDRQEQRKREGGYIMYITA